MTPDLIRFSVPLTETGELGRFRAVPYSGDVIPAYGSLGDVAINLETLRLSNPTPVLIDHDNSMRSTAGFAELSVENGELVAVGKLHKVTEAGAMITALMSDGHPMQLSVGITGSLRKTGGQPITLNGREMKVAAVFEQATVREISFVPVGADPRTSAHLFTKQEQAMPDTNQELDTLRAELAEVKARNEALQTELDDIKAKFSAKIKAEREAALNEFKLADEMKAAMLTMTDEQFSASMALVKSAQKPAPDYLFRDTVQDGGKPPSKEDGPLTAAVRAKFNA